MHDCGIRLVALILRIIGGVLLFIFLGYALGECDFRRDSNKNSFWSNVRFVIKEFFYGCVEALADSDAGGMFCLAILLIGISIGCTAYSNTKTHAVAEANFYYQKYVEALEKEKDREEVQMIDEYSVEIINPKESVKIKKQLDYWYERAKP